MEVGALELAVEECGCHDESIDRYVPGFGLCSKTQLYARAYMFANGRHIQLTVHRGEVELIYRFGTGAR